LQSYKQRDSNRVGTGQGGQRVPSVGIFKHTNFGLIRGPFENLTKWIMQVSTETGVQNIQNANSLLLFMNLLCHLRRPMQSV